MSKQPPPPPAAAAASSSPNDHLSGVDIGKVMGSTGPTVKCVLLRATCGKSDDDEKPSALPAAAPAAAADVAASIDPTRDVSSMSIKDMKRELTSYNVNILSFVEKNELVKALNEARAAAELALANDAKIVTQDDDDEVASSTKPVLHQNLIEEILVDTTPRKSMVSKILGGDFTFLGQYEDEGIMIMIRRPVWETNDTEMEEKDVPPVNLHDLQPPFTNVEVRGDILLMRVAETEEELDYDDAVAADPNNDGKDEDGKKAEAKTSENASVEAQKKDSLKSDKSSPEIHVPTNDEFFLDYTKEEYLKFAARTDIVAEETESSSDEEEGESDDELEGEDDAKKPSATSKLLTNGDDDDSDDDEDFDPDEEEEDLDSEEHQVGMMNMILGHMLRKFREENGRGPDSLELLEMRKALADRLGVEVPPVDGEACDWDKKVATPKKHDKKVVVAEEKNETEEIPCREDSEHGGGGEDDDFEDVGSLKRPAQEGDKDNDEQDQQQGSNKKAKLSEGAGGGGEEES